MPIARKNARNIGGTCQRAANLRTRVDAAMIHRPDAQCHYSAIGRLGPPIRSFSDDLEQLANSRALVNWRAALFRCMEMEQQTPARPSQVALTCALESREIRPRWGVVPRKAAPWDARSRVER